MLDNSDVVVRSTRAPAVTLVPYTAAHVETYHGWLASAALQHDTSSERLSLAEEHANQAEWMTRGDRCTFIVLLDSEAVGDVNLVAVGEEEEGGRKVVEVDVMVAVPAVRGRGVGKRAVVLALAWATRAGRGKVARFVAKILESNDASLALFGGLGFVEERRIAAFGEVHLGLGVDEFEKSGVHLGVDEFAEESYRESGLHVKYERP